MFEFIQSIKIKAIAGTATARAFIPADHPMFADHFTGQPLLPGSILIELGAQAAGPLVEELAAMKFAAERWALLGLIRHAKFLVPVELPAELGIEVAVTREQDWNSTVDVEIIAREVSVFRGELVMVLREADASWSRAIQERRVRVGQWKEYGMNIVTSTPDGV